MRTALRLLWKEWREQRTALALTFALIALGVGGSGLLIGEDPFLDGLVLASAVGACALAALLIVGGELVAGEDARGLRFLERMPSGLRAAFVTKLALFVAVVAAAALFGLAMALSTSAWRSGVEAQPSLHRLLEFDLLAPCAVLTLWTFAASSWVPRGMLALPAAAVALAALAWPVWLACVAWSGAPWFRPLEHEWRLFLALGAAGALAGAAWSFSAGRRFGRASRHAAWRGLVIGALCFAPSWAWAGARWHRAQTIDPLANDFDVCGCWIGEGGRYAFLEGVRWPPGSIRDALRRDERVLYALAIDLESGSWHRLAQPGLRLSAPPDPSRRRPLDSPEPATTVARIELWDPSSGELTEQSIDARTARVERRGDHGGAAPSSTSSWPELAPGLHFGRWAGVGAQVLRKGAEWPLEGYYDPTRGRSFTLRELFRDDAVPERAHIHVRAGAWLVEDSVADEHWVLDPETGERRSLDELSRASSVGPLLEDGRVLLVLDGRIGLFDLDRGEFEELSFADGREEWVQSASNGRTTLAPLGRHQPMVLWIEALGWSGYARLDADDRSLHPTVRLASRPRLVGCFDGETLLVLEDARRLVRLHFDSQEREILFPREP